MLSCSTMLKLSVFWDGKVACRKKKHHSACCLCRLCWPAEFWSYMHSYHYARASPPTFPWPSNPTSFHKQWGASGKNSPASSVPGQREETGPRETSDLLSKGITETHIPLLTMTSWASWPRTHYCLQCTEGHLHTQTHTSVYHIPMSTSSRVSEIVSRLWALKP